MYVWCIIFGINCGFNSMASLPGAGISADRMASEAPVWKRRDMRVLKALRRNPRIIRLITRKMMVPRRIVAVVEGCCCIMEWCRECFLCVHR